MNESTKCHTQLYFLDDYSCISEDSTYFQVCEFTESQNIYKWKFFSWLGVDIILTKLQ